MNVRTLAYACLLAMSGTTVSQTVHELPFASSNNTLELTIENTALLKLANVQIKALNIPSWLKLASQQYVIRELQGKSEGGAIFTFSVDKTAPVRKEQTLTFVISAGNNQSWTKDIRVSVAPPEKFELYQNYPNPFNPSTTISFALPEDGHVTLRVYDMLGRVLAELLNETMQAGSHQTIFNASKLPSGMYFYKLDFGGKSFTKKFVLTK